MISKDVLLNEALEKFDYSEMFDLKEIFDTKGLVVETQRAITCRPMDVSIITEDEKHSNLIIKYNLWQPFKFVRINS